MTELDVNGILLLDTEDSIHVNESSITKVELNYVTVWERAAEVPDPPENFKASDTFETYILCEWENRAKTLTIDLYDDILGIVKTNIVSPYKWYCSASGLSHTLRVIARNEDGVSASNVSTGKLSEPEV